MRNFYTQKLDCTLMLIGLLDPANRGNTQLRNVTIHTTAERINPDDLDLQPQQSNVTLTSAVAVLFGKDTECCL